MGSPSATVKRTSCGPAGILSPEVEPNWNLLECQFCFTGRLRLESSPEAAYRCHSHLGWTEPGRTESSDFAVCVINAPTLEEGGSAVGLQKIAFAHAQWLQGQQGRRRYQTAQPAKSVDSFCADVEGKGVFTYEFECLGKECSRHRGLPLYIQRRIQSQKRPLPRV